ncbi:MAG: hypothetical protein QCI82_03545 [Candidatus Thermoplasmatota archaeon]|nr:hypothetical protein [Candidatus Thermoplasmatota archaeon]
MKARMILIVICGIAMMGQGSRMLYQGIFHPGSYYVPVMFDLFFDWMTLFVLGTVLLALGLKGFHSSVKAPS